MQGILPVGEKYAGLFAIFNIDEFGLKNEGAVSWKLAEYI
jgi:hypothetical protein